MARLLPAADAALMRSFTNADDHAIVAFSIIPDFAVAGLVKPALRHDLRSTRAFADARPTRGELIVDEIDHADRSTEWSVSRAAYSRHAMMSVARR